MNRTRVVQSVADNMRWQAQYFDPSMGLWFDIGDAKDTAEEAEANRADYHSRHRPEDESVQ